MDQDTTSPSVEQLEALWQAAVQQRKACECAVCTQPIPTRAFIDKRLKEIVDQGRSVIGRHGAGIELFAQRVTGPGLGISAHTLKRHRDHCWSRPCSVYPESASDGES